VVVNVISTFQIDRLRLAACVCLCVCIDADGKGFLAHSPRRIKILNLAVVGKKERAELRTSIKTELMDEEDVVMTRRRR
jgi:hypothetical protein